jgi:glucans biosynthesis protein C
MTGNIVSRLHYMDAMRSVLMLLGLVLHSARPYDTDDWVVKDPQRLPLLDGVVSTLHLFRMPAFFVIAGYFAMYLLGRRTTGAFLRERMRRVLVPLTAMLLSVNLVQIWFLARSTEGATADFVDGILIPALWSGDLISHLWFLSCLAVYFAITAALAPLLRGMATARAGESSPRLDNIVFVLALAAAVIAPLGLAVGGKITAPALSQHVLGLVRISTALGYLPFFAMGVLLCAFPGFLDRFAQRGAWVVVLGLCGAIGMYLSAGSESLALKSLWILSESLLAWMVVRVVFSLFRQWANAPSRTFRYLSDASYSIYLFHHFVVIAVATWLVPAEIGAWFKFLIVLGTASLVALGLHHLLVRRYAPLGFLFNGRVTASAIRSHASEPALSSAKAPMPEKKAAPG